MKTLFNTQKVIVIANAGSKHLTQGGIYDIIKETDNHIVIRNDNNKIQKFAKWHFNSFGKTRR